MRAWARALARWDQRALPGVAALLARGEAALASGEARLGRAWGAGRERLLRARAGLTGRLAALDRSLARGGRLARLAAQPAVVLAAAAVLTAAGVAVSSAWPALAPARAPAAMPALAPAALPCGLPRAVQGTAYVGPRPGASVQEFAALATAELRDCAAAAPRLVDLAVVSLDHPQRPGVLAAALGGLPVLAVFVQYGTGPARALPVSGAAGVPAALDLLADRLSAAAARLAAQAGTVPGQGAPARRTRAFLAGAAGDLAAQAGALRAGCACVYGVAVRADLADLAALAQRPGVRLVDPAPVGTRFGRAVLAPLTPGETLVAAASLPVPAGAA